MNMYSLCCERLVTMAGNDLLIKDTEHLFLLGTLFFKFTRGHHSNGDQEQPSPAVENRPRRSHRTRGGHFKVMLVGIRVQK